MREQESILFRMYYFPHDGGWIKARYVYSANEGGWYRENGTRLSGSPEIDKTLTHEQKITVIESYGFTVGKRDPDRKSKYHGSWMVRENAEESDDDWCIVGDDPIKLVNEAFLLTSSFDRHEEVCANVLAGGDGVFMK